MDNIGKEIPDGISGFPCPAVSGYHVLGAIALPEPKVLSPKGQPRQGFCETLCPSRLTPYAVNPIRVCVAHGGRPGETYLHRHEIDSHCLAHLRSLLSFFLQCMQYSIQPKFFSCADLFLGCRELCIQRDVAGTQAHRAEHQRGRGMDNPPRPLPLCHFYLGCLELCI